MDRARLAHGMLGLTLLSACGAQAPEPYTRRAESAQQEPARPYVFDHTGSLQHPRPSFWAGQPSREPAPDEPGSDQPLAGTSIGFDGPVGSRLALLGASLAAPREAPLLLLRITNCGVQVACPSLSLTIDGAELASEQVELHLAPQLLRDGAPVRCVAPGQEFYAVAALAGPVRDALKELRIHAAGTNEPPEAFEAAKPFELLETRLVEDAGLYAEIEARAHVAGQVRAVLFSHGSSGEPLALFRAQHEGTVEAGALFTLRSELLPAGTSLDQLTVLLQSGE